MGDQSWDPTTRATVQKIPLLTVKAGPRDKEEWGKRLKEVCRDLHHPAACRCCLPLLPADAAGLLAQPSLLSSGPPLFAARPAASAGAAGADQVH